MSLARARRSWRAAAPARRGALPAPAAVLATTVAAAVFAAGCATGPDAVDPGNGGQYRFVAGDGTGQLIPADQRRAAPRFTGRYLGGGDFDSAGLAGKVVVLNFWGSWCGPCRVETPEFDKMYRAVRAGGVEFLGVAVKDTEQGAQAFYANKKISYRSLFDPSGRVALTFRGFPPNAIPSTIILDRQGRVAEVYVGTMLRGDLAPVLTRLVAEP
jgi:thiol-disulfide isomerase/thioredoxin